MMQRLGRLRGCLVASLAAVVLLPSARVTAGGADEVVPQEPAPPQRTHAYPDTPGNLAFAEGLRLLGLGEREAASVRFHDAMAYALETGNRLLEAGSHRGLGAVALAQGRHADALREHQRALELFLALDDHANAAGSHVDIGTSLHWLGRRDEARDAWKAALSEFTTLGDLTHQASVLYNLTFVTSDPTDRRALLEQGLALARQARDVSMEGLLLSARSDAAFVGGDYRAAFDDIQGAIALLSGPGMRAQAPLTRAYTSLGRVYRAHAQFEQAIAAYERALEIQRQTNDLQGQAQSARAIAVSYDGLGRQDLRRRFLELSLETIRATDAIDEQRFAETHLASFLVDAGDMAGAFRLLDGVVSTEWGRRSEWALNTLARAHVAAGEPARAIDPATRGIALSREAGDVERLFHGLVVRAQAWMALGRFTDAVDDTREALNVIERLRQRLVPHDYMKRGFTDRFRATFGMALESLDRLGRPADAMEVAERGRARAFSDLLLARRVSRTPEPLPAGPSRIGHAGRGQRPPAAMGDAAMATRGGIGSKPPESGDDLPNDASAPPAAIADMRRAATALDVSILGYWVDRDTTFAWLLRPDGDVVSARVQVSDVQLRDLVSQVWQPSSSARAEAVAADGSRVAASRNRGRASTQATRELYRLLVLPLRHALPQRPGSRLLVIPHGPLSVLSFAALQDARGRYLIEDYAVAYAPAASVLTLDESRAPRRQTSASYLLVGAPATLPRGVNGEALGSLPGARRELAAVEGRVGASRAVRLTGRSASEARLRAALAGASVLHLATHGVMFDDAPLDSYLALDATGATGDAGDDGRLSAREIYDLDVRADLVVLSACRSGLGRLSGDGLFGLARAFFYAGARSVVATLWDVADEPSARLMPRFHEMLARGSGASESLRAAQLALLHDLRAGRVVVQGRRGPVPLPEHPSLWAGFVVLGRP